MMNNNYKLLKLEDVADIVSGGTPSTSTNEFWNGNIPWVTPKDLSGYNKKRILRGERNITEAGLINSSARLVPKNSVLFTSRAPIGYVAIADAELTTNQGFKNLVLKEGHDPDFYYYLLKVNKDKIESYASGSTFKEISASVLRQMEFKIPPYETQKNIASFLSKLDDKIELNNLINETLETMAKAIFKEWFVDFGPVKAKAEGKKPFGMDDESAALFPNSFEESELGLIPKGWGVESLSEVSDFQEGPGIMAVDFHDEGIPLIRLSGLKNGVSLLEGCNYLSPLKVKSKWHHFLLKQGDILLSTSASLGRVAVVDQEAEGAIAYTGIIRFRAVETKCTQTYLKHYLTSGSFQKQVEAFGVGSVLKHFGPTHLKGMKVLKPTINIQTAFQNLVEASDILIRNAIAENVSLSHLSDLLLPKLISGEIELKDLS